MADEILKEEDNLLTKEEVDALIDVVGNVQTTVKSAGSWLTLRSKLRSIRKQFDISMVSGSEKA